MNVGMRVIYDNDGEIVAILGEMTGDVMARKEGIELHYIDVEHGAINFEENQLLGVNVEEGTLILQPVAKPETPESARIEELENLLLLQAEDRVGGLM